LENTREHVFHVYFYLMFFFFICFSMKRILSFFVLGAVLSGGLFVHTASAQTHDIVSSHETVAVVEGGDMHNAAAEAGIEHEGGLVSADEHESLTHEEEHEGGHSDPVAPVLLGIVVILLSARIGGRVFEKLGQPSVLGELIFGVLVGNMHLLGVHWFTSITGDPHIDILSRLGVVVLLFMVGLESNVKEMVKVGVPSLLVATVGVIAPFALGFFVSQWFFPEAAFNVHLFIGATLTATSVGITARVFKDLGKLKLPEAKIILGAAVIDDVMGLIVLSVVSGIITTGVLSWGSVAWITFKSLLFLAAAIGLGSWIAPRVGKYVSGIPTSGLKLITALIFAFIFSWAANAIGLATIVGAFAAGLILDDVHFKGTKRTNHHGEKEEEYHIDDLVRPIADFLVPIFFVLMGMQVKLETFADMKVLGVAAGLTIAAIIGKQVCSFVVSKKKYARLVIGLGMIPRGEVGLIFAAIGKSLGVVNDSIFSAIVIMVIVTTLATPPALKFALDRVKTKDDDDTALKDEVEKHESLTGV
jgi:Kef-type K+ transport system membrane component KefB